MRPIPRLFLPERVAGHLREGIRQGRWSGSLPGVHQLAAELDVARHTVRRALRLLEDEGILAARGLGRSRSIAAADAVGAFQRPLRVGILRHDARLADCPQSSMVLLQIVQALEAAGHTVFFCKKSQIELKHEFSRISRHLEAAGADVWVIESGSLPLLEWCAIQRTPCLALHGRTTIQPLARIGVNAVSAYRAATRRLLELGHRRIVLVVRESVREPTLGLCARAFLEELSAYRITTSGFNLPAWEETPAGFNRLLGDLFKGTPPTALIIDETPRVIAALAFLARRGLKVPDQVSLVYADADAIVDWCHPPIARMQWNSTPIVRNVVHWVDTVRKGRPDRKIKEVTSEFIPGGSIGPVWKG
jgi:DNA-binding LacI/PurR family transcriptional regulator